jgi:hypothetical protein
MNAKTPRCQGKPETFLPLPLRERAGVRGKHGKSVAQISPIDVREIPLTLTLSRKGRGNQITPFLGVLAFIPKFPIANFHLHLVNITHG